MADRPVMRRTRRIRADGGEVELGAQPPQHIGVGRPALGEHPAARGEVVGGDRRAGWWEFPGGNAGRQIDAHARDAEPFGDDPTQRARAERGEQHVRAGGRGGQHAVAQCLEVLGKDRSHVIL